MLRRRKGGGGRGRGANAAAAAAAVTCHRASVTVPWSWDGSLRSLVTLPGWKQLVSTEGCLVALVSSPALGIISSNPLFFFFKLFSFYQLASIAIYLAACGPTQPELMPNRFCENSPSIPARPNNPIPCKSAALILAVEG